MSNNPHTENEFVHSKYEQLINSRPNNDAILVAHFGALSQTVISDIEGSVEKQISELGISKGSIKKVFFISVETLQNMLLHGQKNSDGEQNNFFILMSNGEKLKIISSNLVDNITVPILDQKISEINSFEDEKALKSYYLEHLENNIISDKGGAGLGFITIGMKSGNKLNVTFDKISDHLSLFTLVSEVNLS